MLAQGAWTSSRSTKKAWDADWQTLALNIGRAFGYVMIHERLSIFLLPRGQMETEKSRESTTSRPSFCLRLRTAAFFSHSV